MAHLTSAEVRIEISADFRQVCQHIFLFFVKLTREVFCVTQVPLSLHSADTGSERVVKCFFCQFN